MTQEACAGGKCTACRTLAGICINALTGNPIIHRHDRQFAQRLLRMTAKKAVAQAQYPRPGRVRAADLCNGLSGKAEFIICRADHANSILPDHIRPFAEAVIRQELQTSGRLIIDIVMPGQIDRPCKIRLSVCILFDAMRENRRAHSVCFRKQRSALCRPPVCQQLQRTPDKHIVIRQVRMHDLIIRWLQECFVKRSFRVAYFL